MAKTRYVKLVVPHIIMVCGAFHMQPFRLGLMQSGFKQSSGTIMHVSPTLVDDSKFISKRKGREKVTQGETVVKSNRNELLDRKWWTMYRKLSEYKAEHGNCRVPQNYDDDEDKSDVTFLPALGKWVSMQRRKYNDIVQMMKKDSLIVEEICGRSRSKTNIVERIEALQDLGFIWDANDATWFTMYEKFCKHRKGALLRQKSESNNSSDIPVAIDFPQGNNHLSMWISNQRTQYRYLQEEKVSSLTAERIQLLEAQNFIWDKKDDAWWNRYHELKAYRKTYRHCSIPAKYELNPSLGHWVSVQRVLYKKNTLSDERKMYLDELGFVWDPSEQFWHDRFEELKLYKEEHGHCFVPKSCNQYRHLGHWISNQRRLGILFHRGEECGGMTESRIELLNDIGFGWPYEDESEVFMDD